jgi:hypothetical protein
MDRLLFPLLAALLVATAATADVPPPPPPKGQKYVTVDSAILLGKGVTGYVFVKQDARGPGRPQFDYSRVELGEKEPVTLPGGRRAYATLFAVPEEAAKAFKTDKELFDALAADEVKGTHRLGFVGAAAVSDKVKGDAVKWTYAVTGIDAKGGFEVKTEGDGYEAKPEKPAGEKKPPAAEPASLWVAGVAAFAAVPLGGVWFAGRARRKA